MDENKQVVTELQEPSPNDLSRDLTKAREAYKKGDVDASRDAHAPKSTSSHNENHRVGGDYVKSIIYGGLDGITTTFAIIAGVVGGGIAVQVILILGFSNIIADGISMGISDTLSDMAEHDYSRSEKKRETWECDHNLEGEINEMVQLYQTRGLPETDARAAIGILSKHKDFFVDVMMVEELGLLPPDANIAPWKSGLVTFFSFCIFGTVPLLAYVGDNSTNKNTLFGIACALTAATLFILGAVKSRFTRQRWYSSGLQVLLVGSVSAAASYLISWLIQDLLHVPSTC